MGTNGRLALWLLLSAQTLCQQGHQVRVWNNRRVGGVHIKGLRREMRMSSAGDGLPGRIGEKSCQIRYTRRRIGSCEWLLCRRNWLWPLLKSRQKRLKSRSIHCRDKIRNIGRLRMRKGRQWRRRNRRWWRQRRDTKCWVWRKGSRSTATLHRLRMEDNLSCDVGL